VEEEEEGEKRIFLSRAPLAQGEEGWMTCVS